MRIEQFQEHAAMFDEIVADLAGPENLNEKAPISLTVALAGEKHADFLTLEISGADQSNSRGGNVATQKLNLAMIRREDFGDLNERNAAMLPSFQVDRSNFIFANDLADDLVYFALVMIVARAGSRNRNVIIPAVAVVQKSLGQGDDIFPMRFGQARLGQRFPDFAADYKALIPGPLDDLVGNPLQVG